MVSQTQLDKPRTAKQQAWVEAVLQGCNHTEAARQAGYAKGTEKYRGRDNATYSHLTKEIDRRRADIAKETGWSVERSQRLALDAYDLAMQQNQPSAAVSSLVSINRLHGLDKDNDARTKDAPAALSVEEIDRLKSLSSQMLLAKPVESVVIESKENEHEV